MSWVVDCFGSTAFSFPLEGSGGGDGDDDGDGGGLEMPGHSLVCLRTARGRKAKGVVIGFESTLCTAVSVSRH